MMDFSVMEKNVKNVQKTVYYVGLINVKYVVQVVLMIMESVEKFQLSYQPVAQVVKFVHSIKHIIQKVNAHQAQYMEIVMNAQWINVMNVHQDY